MRLIDASRAVSKVEKIPFLEDKNRAFYEGCRYMQKRVLRILHTSKTIDAGPVVRCRDCKHNVENWNHDELDVTDYTDITCDFFMTDGMQPDDFCSYGERKDGDTK